MDRDESDAAALDDDAWCSDEDGSRCEYGVFKSDGIPFPILYKGARESDNVHLEKSEIRGAST